MGFPSNFIDKNSSKAEEKNIRRRARARLHLLRSALSFEPVLKPRVLILPASMDDHLPIEHVSSSSQALSLPLNSAIPVASVRPALASSSSSTSSSSTSIRISVIAMTGAVIAIDDASAADTILSIKQRVFAANRKLHVRRQR
jgi:hypothetical protein